MQSDRLYTPPQIGDSELPDIIHRRNRRAFTNVLQRRGGEITVGRHIAVCVGGSCLHNGNPPKARGGSGVYFGPGSRYNMSEPLALSPYERHTNHRAELNAAIIALERVKQLLDDRELNTRFVVLVTSSAYVVDGITQFVFKWRENGYINAKGTSVVNGDDFRRLDELVNELKDDFDVFVKFWHVRNWFNEEARELAKEASASIKYCDSDDDDDYSY